MYKLNKTSHFLPPPLHWLEAWFHGCSSCCHPAVPPLRMWLKGESPGRLMCHTEHGNIWMLRHVTLLPARVTISNWGESFITLKGDPFTTHFESRVANHFLGPGVPPELQLMSRLQRVSSPGETGCFEGWIFLLSSVSSLPSIPQALPPSQISKDFLNHSWHPYLYISSKKCCLCRNFMPMALF